MSRPQKGCEHLTLRNRYDCYPDALVSQQTFNCRVRNTDKYPNDRCAAMTPPEKGKSNKRHPLHKANDDWFRAGDSPRNEPALAFAALPVIISE